MKHLFQRIIVFLFKLSGWNVVGEIPSGMKKAVLVGAPHTSNWDLFYTLGLMYTIDLKFRFLIKEEAMVFPIKYFLRAFGAYPVARSEPGHHYVDQIAHVFDEDEECFLCIAPEGTRKPVKKWKTGFYHIAEKAEVPILIGYLDCSKKNVHIGEVLDPSRLSEEAAMAELKEILKKAVAKKPENFVL